MAEVVGEVIAPVVDSMVVDLAVVVDFPEVASLVEAAVLEAAVLPVVGKIKNNQGE